jgi:hypothetical protein
MDAAHLRTRSWLLLDFLVECNSAKGSLVVSFPPPKHEWKSDQTVYTALCDGGTFRWVMTQRRGCDLHPATTEPMDLCFYFTALPAVLEA